MVSSSTVLKSSEAEAPGKAKNSSIVLATGIGPLKQSRFVKLVGQVIVGGVTSSAHGSPSATRLPNNMKGNPCCGLPVPESLAGLNVTPLSNDCNPFPVLAVPVIVIGGAQGPEPRVPFACHSNQ